MMEATYVAIEKTIAAKSNNSPRFKLFDDNEDETPQINKKIPPNIGTKTDNISGLKNKFSQKRKKLLALG